MWTVTLAAHSISVDRAYQRFLPAHAVPLIITIILDRILQHCDGVGVEWSDDEIWCMHGSMASPGKNRIRAKDRPCVYTRAEEVG